MSRLRRVVAALAVGVCLASVSDAQAVGTRPVPWLGVPLPLYRIPSPKLITYPTSAPPCTSDVIRVRAGRTGAATGNLLEEFIFTNTGATACLLRGYPRVAADAPSGRRVVLHPTHGTFFGPLAPSDLRPHAHVFLDFGTGDGCNAGLKKATIYRAVSFRLATGERIDGGKIIVSAVCGLSMSSFGLQPRYQLTPRPGTPEVLVATIRLPATVRAGTALRYTVTLKNPTGRTVRFGSCPGYTEGLFTSGAQARLSYRLNCGRLGKLPPHRLIAFAMQLPVPRTATRGVAKVGWNLNSANGPTAGGVVTVSG